MPNISLATLLLLATIWMMSGCDNESRTQDSEIRAMEEEMVMADSLPSWKIVRIDSFMVERILQSIPQFDPVADEVRDFYKNENYRTLWFGPYGLTEQTGKIINLVSAYFENGILDSTILNREVLKNYRIITSPDFQLKRNDTLMMESDVMFTAQFLLIANKAWKGIGGSKARQVEWFLPVKQISFTDYLRQALTDTAAAGRMPVFVQYNRMADKLNRYHRILKSGGFTQVALSGKSLAPGDSAEAVAEIRKRLYEEGYAIQDTSGHVMDDELAAMIRKSRLAFGLHDTALVDPALIKEWNVPADKRIRTMLINLERWKWIPEKVSERYLVVNLPDFKLHVFENGKKINSMKVVIGKEMNQTIIFTGNIAEVVFSPYWTVPVSIIVNEMLPAIRKNRNYLRDNHLEIVSASGQIMDAATIDWNRYHHSFPYNIRQKPGPDNSLGRVKFLFPNPYSIYLHDTPAKHLFSRDTRMFSHGCIRIEDPEWLANYLLADQPEWDETSIRQAMDSGNETTVKTIQPTPVYITYFTSWVDSEGTLHFRNDIYGHDRKLEGELFSRQ